jgi:NarL family two-component system sensor histidine kinase LiaS
LLKIFYQLRWTLALSYTLITISAVIVADVIYYTISDYLFRSNIKPEMLATRSAAAAPQVLYYLQSLPDKTVLKLWLRSLRAELQDQESGLYPNPFFSINDFDPQALAIAVIDHDGEVLATAPEQSISNNQAFSERLISSKPSLIALALQGETNLQRLSEQEEDGTIIAAIPVFDSKKLVRGVFFVYLSLPFDWRKIVLSTWSEWTDDRGVGFLIFATIGLVFSSLISPALIRRLNRISAAADAWSQGDFSAVADDHSPDELGQLARRLDSMAKELQNVVSLQQALAALEERNRLARDLHDTVKQQVFALGMQIGAAHTLIDQKPETAKAHLSEAAKLTQQAQQELVAIIQELRPTDQKSKSPVAALQDYVRSWSQQSGITSDVRANSAVHLTPASEQALIRITQEALANVARHSGATHIQVELQQDSQNNVILAIADNGKGFDLQATTNGIGLQTMRERAEALPRGWFIVKSHIGKGTMISVGCEMNVQGEKS